MTSSVHLEIAPLDLTPWPSTTSSVGRLGSMGRQSSLAPQLSVVKEHTQEQVSRSLFWHDSLKLVQSCWRSASGPAGHDLRTCTLADAGSDRCSLL